MAMVTSQWGELIKSHVNKLRKVNEINKPRICYTSYHRVKLINILYVVSICSLIAITKDQPRDPSK